MHHGASCCVDSIECIIMLCAELAPYLSESILYESEIQLYMHRCSLGMTYFFLKISMNTETYLSISATYPIVWTITLIGYAM